MRCETSAFQGFFRAFAREAGAASSFVLSDADAAMCWGSDDLAPQEGDLQNTWYQGLDRKTRTQADSFDKHPGGKGPVCMDANVSLLSKST